MDKEKIYEEAINDFVGSGVHSYIGMRLSAYLLTTKGLDRLAIEKKVTQALQEWAKIKLNERKNK